MEGPPGDAAGGGAKAPSSKPGSSRSQVPAGDAADTFERLEKAGRHPIQRAIIRKTQARTGGGPAPGRAGRAPPGDRGL